jgi:hypothetical protein
VGEYPSGFGWAVGSAGDVNGDGYSDLVVGATTTEGYSGEVYVYHGSPAGLAEAPAWSAVCENLWDGFGMAVGSAGDVNGDGYSDVAVGAYRYDDWRGKVYVYHGSPAGLEANAAWTEIGEVYAGYGAELGSAVGTAGDVNGDGYGDLVVGAKGYDYSRGKVYLYHGSATGLIQDAPADWTATGENAWDYFGGDTVGTAGDVNGDGYDDLVVGVYYVDSGRGRAYVYHGSATGLGENNRLPDWTATGENASGGFVNSVATAGDVNGDGYADLVVGATHTEGYSGKAYVYHGSEAGLETDAAWTTTGENAWDCLGWAVATAGDVNGDGYSDLVVGAYNYDGGRGKVYLYPGSALGLTPPFDWTAAGEEAADSFGYAVATAGDVNGDGYSDVAVGAYGYDGGRGRAYVYHGSAAGLAESPAWSASGQNAGDRFGRAVMTAGDVNGDGYDDLVVGAWGYNNNTGRAYLFPGSSAGLAETPVFTATGQHPGDSFGLAVAAAGDVDGDRYDDLVIGAAGYPGGSNYGVAYLYRGSAAGLAAAPAWSASGESAGSYFGAAVAPAGDVNGDGLADLAVGAYGYSSYRGRVYLYYGRSPGGLGAEPAFTASGDNPADYLGWSLGTAGDVNGDGYSDLAAGAWGYDAPGRANAGRVSVYYGSVAGLGGSAALTITGVYTNAYFGTAVATAGDVNGDGYADLLAGASGYNTSAGQASLYFGSAAGLVVTPTWSAAGRRASDHFGAALGTAGDVNGDGYSDLVVGAWGYDEPGNEPGDPPKINAGRAYVYHGAASGPSPTFGWSQAGENAGDSFGAVVAMAGDVNGDGYSDLVVGADGYGGGQGKVYLYYGSSAGFTVGEADWTATGVDADNLPFFFGDRYGHSVAAAGDVNGDGYGDLVVGAWGYDGDGKEDAGIVYLYYGSSSGLSRGDPPEPDWTVTGEGSYDNLGWVVGSAGDVNGDGYGDLAVSARLNPLLGFGQVSIYHGSAAGLASEPAWSHHGTEMGEGYGYTVATAGDVNGDGYSDLVVAASGTDGRGEVYGYYGSSGGLKPGQGAGPLEPDWSAEGENPWDGFGSFGGHSR